MEHYVRETARGAYRHYAYVICASCYARLSANDQRVYGECVRDCGTIAGCERCEDNS